MPVEDVDEAFPKLRQLQVDSCKMLTGDLPHFLHSLTSLYISNCEKLACSLPKMPIVCSIYLWHFNVDSYSFTENRSPQKLAIGGASKFVSYELLESLSLSDLPASLKSFPLDSFPKIKSLQISDSPNLESISVSDWHCQALKSLSSLHLIRCPNFIMFPGDGFTFPCLNGLYISGCPNFIMFPGDSFPSLTSLNIIKCDRLKFLQETLHNLFPSLQDLSIHNCPEVESFFVIGLPLKLQYLYISNCEKLINSNWMSWNLKTLPNLTTFEITGSGDVTSFPEEGLLPPTLTSLTIYDLSSLETLDNSGLRALTSLKNLSISNCAKLKTIPEEGLPTSLEKLSIFECPLLEKKCKRKKGKYWTKIAHIPDIRINFQFVNYI